MTIKMTRSRRKRWRGALAAMPLLIGGALSAAPPGDDPATLLRRARKAVSAGERVEAWRNLDLASSNYPEVQSTASDLIQTLDAACTEDQRVGRVSVATWRGGKQAAVSWTFDDSLPSAYRHAAPDLERRGWRGTFFLTDKTLKNQPREPWKALAQKGHEIGCHTVSHIDRGFPDQAAAVIDSELDCGAFLTPGVIADPPLTFAYPDSNPGAADGPLRAAVRNRYLAARSGMARDGTRVSRASPERTDALVSFPVHTATTLNECERELDKAARLQGWLIFMYHAVIDHDGWQPVSPENWRGCLDLVTQRQGDLWIAPLVQVAAYIQCRRTAETHWDWDGRRVRITVRSNLERTPPDTRLTISVRVPRSWRNVEISSETGSRAVRDGEVTFDLRPDGAPVLLAPRDRP